MLVSVVEKWNKSSYANNLALIVNSLLAAKLFSK